MPTIKQFLNGYELIRVIGKGGFGTVYLSRDKDSKEYIALKVVEGESAEKEMNFLSAKNKKMFACECSNILPILDCYKYEDGIFYTMPLADGLYENCNPESIMWRTKSLEALIRQKESNPSTPWFSETEIFEITKAIFNAAVFLNEASVLHRDIKPANLLFYKDKLYLADFGIAQADKNFGEIEAIGSEFFAAPQGYIAKGGNPDMWGVAATLFKLATGNSLNFIDRSSAVYPIRQIETLTDEQKARYQHWRRCILRAISENSNMRFLRMKDFQNAFFSDDFRTSKVAVSAPLPSANNAYYNVKLANTADCIDDIIELSKVKIDFTSGEIAAKQKQVEVFSAVKEYMADKDYHKAIEILDKALQDLPSATCYTMRGACKYALKQFQLALADYDLAIAQDANCAKAYHGKALCYTIFATEEMLSLKDKNIKESPETNETFLSYLKLSEINMKKAAALGDEKAKRLIEA